MPHGNERSLEKKGGGPAPVLSLVSFAEMRGVTGLCVSRAILGQMKDDYGPAAMNYTLCIVLCASTATPPILPSSVGMSGDGGGITGRPDLEVRRELESFLPQSNDL